MAAGLHGRMPVFTQVVDTVFDLMGSHGAGIAQEWLAGCDGDMLDDVTRAQPLLYAIDYALGREVLSWGVAPAALLGHSVGELAAATLAGVLQLPEAVRIMADRVKRLVDSPPGGMLAVAAPAEQLERYLVGDVTVAAVNAPRQTLVAGPEAELATVAERLRSDGITCRRARARQAFHSPAMEPWTADSATVWRSVSLREPRIPVYSGFLAAPLTADTARDPAFWARHPVDPVLFWPALCRLFDDLGDALLLEVGPGDGLSTLARLHPALRRGTSTATHLLPRGGTGDDLASVTAAIDHLRAAGHALSCPVRDRTDDTDDWKSQGGSA